MVAIVATKTPLARLPNAHPSCTKDAKKLRTIHLLLRSACEHRPYLAPSEEERRDAWPRVSEDLWGESEPEFKVAETHYDVMRTSNKHAAVFGGWTATRHELHTRLVHDVNQFAQSHAQKTATPSDNSTAETAAADAPIDRIFPSHGEPVDSAHNPKRRRDATSEDEGDGNGVGDTAPSTEATTGFVVAQESHDTLADSGLGQQVDTEEVERYGAATVPLRRSTRNVKRRCVREVLSGRGDKEDDTEGGNDVPNAPSKATHTREIDSAQDSMLISAIVAAKTQQSEAKR